jgi:hypothetical protein
MSGQLVAKERASPSSTESGQSVYRQTVISAQEIQVFGSREGDGLVWTQRHQEA